VGTIDGLKRIKKEKRERGSGAVGKEMRKIGSGSRRRRASDFGERLQLTMRVAWMTRGTSRGQGRGGRGVTEVSKEKAQGI